MSVPFEELEKLKDYRFGLERFQTSLLNLTIFATSREKPHRKVYLQFVEVGYIKMPMDWLGGLELGSAQERAEIAALAGLPVGGLSSTTQLYKSRQGEVLILGSLMLIEEPAP